MKPDQSSSPDTGEIPRFVAIKADLLDRIRTGELKPGDKTESENELALRFNVSRPTVQRAILELVSEGRLVRTRGSGTYVANRPGGFSLFEVRDLGEQIWSQGGDPQVDVLIQRKLVPDETVRSMMEISKNVPVFEAILLRRNGNEPVAIEGRYARCDIFTDFLTRDFARESIYEYLAATVKLGILETHLSAITPSQVDSHRLAIPAGDPCLFLERLNRVNGLVVTLSRFTFAGSRFGLSSIYNAN